MVSRRPRARSSRPGRSVFERVTAWILAVIAESQMGHILYKYIYIYDIRLYYVMLYYIILYDIILYYIMLYYICISRYRIGSTT